MVVEPCTAVICVNCPSGFYCRVSVTLAVPLG